MPMHIDWCGEVRSVVKYEVLMIVTVIGEGVEGDPVRELHTIVDTKTGNVLAQRDTWELRDE